jgi:hypothetical protein
MTEPTAGALKLAETLFASYRQDQATGLLDARLHHEAIGDEVLAISAEWANAAWEELTASDEVSMLSTAGYDWAFFVEAHNTVEFHQALLAVRRYGGDPPAGEALQRHALDILRGRVHLAGAVRLVALDTGLQEAFPHLFQTFLPGVDPATYPVFGQAVRVAAAAALPRADLLKLRGLASPEPETPETTPPARELDEVRGEFQRIVAQAERLAGGQQDPGREEALLVRALALAGQSPEPDDDIEALQRILALAARFRVSDGCIEQCLAAAELLVRQGHRSQALAQCVAALGPLVHGHELYGTLGERLIHVGDALLGASLNFAARRGLVTAVARAWLALDRPDQARLVLSDLDRTAMGPTERLGLAILEAEALKATEDAGRATTVLVEALQGARTASAMDRIPALQKLLALWPDTYDSEVILPFFDELLDTAGQLKEPRRTLCLVNLAIRLWPLGRKVQALRAWSMIDEDRLRRETPPVLAAKVLSVVERTRQKLDTKSEATVVR